MLPVATLATVAVTAASAAAQAPGLPRTYNATRIDSPTPVGGGAFGWGIYSADLTGDRKHDLLVAQSQVGTLTDPNKIFIFNGVNGALVDTIVPPEDNPRLFSATNPTGYVSPEMGFVYVETMPDIGSCPAGPATDRICNQAAISPGDGIPEILVGSRALKVNKDNGTTPATNADRAVGRGYVIDGATRAVLKRIDMPVADRRQNDTLAGSPAFGRTMSSPQGLPPCAGPREENNDAGVGECPSGNDRRYTRAVRIGDVNGGGQPDIVITARGFPESGDVMRNVASTPPGESRLIPGTAPAGTTCRAVVRTQPEPTEAVPNPPLPTPATCSAGKAWVYAGEAIARSDPRAILDTAVSSIRNPDAQVGGGEFGGNMFRVGDVTGQTAGSLPDGVPDFVIPIRSADLPLRNPDPDAGLNAGAAYLYSGVNGLLTRTIVSPQPQIRSQFSGSFNAGRAVGDLGATDTPDILLPAAFQNERYADEGKLWILNGDTTAGGGGEQSWNLGMLTDPEPYIGGNFGGGQTGVGDLVGGPGAPANEVLVGGFHFDTFTEASENTVPDVNFMNATLDKNLMTIPHPEGGRGDGFGVGLTPMGDLNDDGFLDFAVSAYLANGPLGGQGRAWIFKSDNSPAAAGPAPAAELKAGSCANRKTGSNRRDTLRGTRAGDELFGLNGNDSILGLQGHDCIDAGRGNDRAWGGTANDKIIGGTGRDTVKGEIGNDQLFGGTGNDRVDGGVGRDMVAGGASNDQINGGAHSDRLFGEAGADRITGGSGQNLVDGGAGNDSIDVRNGSRDRVLCGTGVDRVRADRIDRLNRCEIVTYRGKIK